MDSQEASGTQTTSKVAIDGKCTDSRSRDRSASNMLRPRDERLVTYLSTLNSDGSMGYDMEHSRPNFLESVQEGPGHWGQVRKVSFHEDFAAVIEKAWDPTLFKNEHHMSAESMNASEIFAYESLRELQGNVIPWYYGHGIRLNDQGERIPLMLLECIDGKTLQKWLSHERSK